MRPIRDLPPGTPIRSTHPLSYRTGEWAVLIAHDTRGDGRPTWLVAFADGATDTWVADDPLADWEIAQPPDAEHEGGA